MTRTITCLAGLLLACSSVASAQDEGVIKKRDRIDRDKSIFINFGPSFTFGKNIGDYQYGFNAEVGFTKRLNRVLSVGPSISYIAFDYDPEVTTNKEGNAYVGTGDPNGWGEKYGFDDLSYAYGYALELTGGDLSLTSLGVTIKVNFVPIKDDTKVSVYGFAKPFITLASRKAVHGTEQQYTYEIYEDDNNTATQADDVLHYNLDDGTAYPYGGTDTWGPENYPALKSDTEVTGGIFIGPGVELFPTRKFSFFLQAAFGYTFPVTYVSTEAYDKTIEDYTDPEFPMVKKGFPSLNVQFGASFNF